MSHFLERLTYLSRRRERFADGHGKLRDEDRTWEKTMRHERRHARFTIQPAANLRRRGGLLVRLMAVLCFGSGATLAAAQEGKTTFDTDCAACHRIGGGRLVGPDLAGVSERHAEDWLIRFVKSAQAMVSSGDKTAVALSKEFEFVMPDQNLSDAEIRATLAYIKTAGGAAALSAQTRKESAAAAPASSAAAQPEQIQLGQDLFEGKVRFVNGGPSCNACHTVTSDALLGGAILAPELTLMFSSLGQEGMRAIIANSPFPVMQAAYGGKGFSEYEISALVAFLQKADEEHSRQLPKAWGWRMFSAGIGGVIVLAGIAGLAGRRRKKQCVNQQIYDRQVRSC